MEILLRIKVIKEVPLSPEEIVPVLEGVQRAVSKLAPGEEVTTTVVLANSDSEFAYYVGGKIVYPVRGHRRVYGYGRRRILADTWTGAHEGGHLVQALRLPASSVFPQEKPNQIADQVRKEIEQEIEKTRDYSGDAWVKQRERILRDRFDF